MIWFNELVEIAKDLVDYASKVRDDFQASLNNIRSKLSKARSPKENHAAAAVSAACLANPLSLVLALALGFTSTAGNSAVAAHKHDEANCLRDGDHDMLRKRDELDGCCKKAQRVAKSCGELAEKFRRLSSQSQSKL